MPNSRSNELAYAELRALIDNLLDVWVPRFNLEHWDIEIVYLDSFDPEEEQDGDFHTCMNAECKWNYMLAKLKVWMPSAIRFNAAEIEKTLVHELCHVLLSAEQHCITKATDSEKLELSTELCSKVIYNAWRR